MTKQWILFAVVLSLAFSARAQIEINIVEPEPGALSGDPVRVVATVTSTFELDEVTAMVEGRTSSLTFSEEAYLHPRFGYYPGWVGTISLEGLPKGELDVSVTAVDLVGNSASESVTFAFNELPVLTVEEPLAESTATPQIRVRASCADDDEANCLINVRVGTSGNDQPVASGESQIDEVLDLSAFDHSTVTLRIEAVDSAGQTVFEERRIYVESNARLMPIENVPGKILDVSQDRILFTEDQGEDMTLKIYHRSTGETTVVFDEPGGSIRYGFLAPKGAIFVEQSGNVLTARILDYRDGELIDLGQPNSASSLVVEGRYAIYNQSTTLYRRDLVEGADVVVSTHAGNWRNDVTPEGTVAYWTSVGEYQVSRFENGGSSQLTDDDDLWNTYPLTDGQNVVYRKHTPCCGSQTYAIALHDGTRETILSPAREGEPSAGRDYAAEGGWVAFAKAGTGGQNQIWVKPPDSSAEQRSFFGTGSRITRLSEEGELIFENQGTNYVSRPNGEFHDLGRYIGETIRQNQSWRVVIGRTLFALDSSRDTSILIGIARREDGQYVLTLERQDDRDLMLQSSPDLVEWTDVQELTGDEDSVEIGNLEAGGAERKFYRAVGK